jgi:hypothetical protein
VNVRKNGSERSMTKASSLMIMHAALSSVNLGSNSKRSLPPTRRTTAAGIDTRAADSARRTRRDRGAGFERPVLSVR